MRQIDKSLLFRYIMINLVASSLIALVLWYTGRFIEGICFSIKLILGAPSFFIVALLTGMNNAMHFTTQNTYRIVSFIFYSAVIALIQLIIYKQKRERQQNKV